MTGTLALRTQEADIVPLPFLSHVPNRHKIGLILSGNGAHSVASAAFLARFLPDETIANSEISFITGVSGGAKNAAIAARALNDMHIGERRARLLAATNLKFFWDDNTIEKHFNRASLDFMKAAHAAYKGTFPVYRGHQHTMHTYLKRMVEKHLPDDPNLSWDRTDLYIGTASQNEGGKVIGHVHKNGEISVMTHMASAAVPRVFPAVVLNDGRHHIDGACYANPIVDSVVPIHEVDDLIFIHCGTSKPVKENKDTPPIRNSWERVEQIRNALPPSVSFHNVTIDVRLPDVTKLWPIIKLNSEPWVTIDENLLDLTKLRPTRTQNKALWEMGERAAVEFIAAHYATDRPALRLQ